MVANPIWIAAYGGPPPTAIGAAPVWIALSGDSVCPVCCRFADRLVMAGLSLAASPVWIAAGGAPHGEVGATPITLRGMDQGGQ